MMMDARTLPDAALLEADVCTIGAGPAGLTIAHALDRSGLDVLVLESGGQRHDDAVQALNDGPVVGDAYAGLRVTRSRGLSGTVRLWNTPVDGEPGAKYAPLDAPDFEPVPAPVVTGWPFDRAHLEPYYRHALGLCGLGRFAWDATDWPDERPPALAGDALTQRVYQFGTAHALITPLLHTLRTSDNVRLLVHATACALEFDGRLVRCVSVADPAGRRFRVQSKLVILAGGAIENARLLLVSDATRVLAGHRWIGRCFMEHPRDASLTLVPRSPAFFREAAFYDRHRAADGTRIGGRIALSGATPGRAGVPNASVTLLPRLRSAAGSGRALAWLRQLGRRRGQEGYGWSAVPDPAGVFDAFRLLINLEHRPHPENRIALADTRDALGVPRPALHFRWRDEDQAGLVRLRALIAETLEASGIGAVRGPADARPDPNAHHHAGTTRMHVDAAHGVTDGDGLVHGSDNLYVTGASLFPTAGFANPALTILALALRLADHLLRRR